MTTSSNEPNQQDAILGGDAPAPAQAAVLGGLGPVQERLSSSDLATKFAAMKDCLNYGEAGIAKLLLLLEESLPRTQWEAYQLLRDCPDKLAERALKRYKFWQNFERLEGYPEQHCQIFANRQVVDFPIPIAIKNWSSVALGVRANRRASRGHREDEDVEKKLVDFLTMHEGSLIEAIVLGYGVNGPEGRDLLVREQSSLPNLRAIFLGDIEDQEQMISYIAQSDLSPLLSTYPDLEILHIRGDMGMLLRKIADGDGLRFSPNSHQKLTTLIVETGGLSQKAIDDICNLSLPSIEYLELWMGSSQHGSDSQVENLLPILCGEKFSTLKYLGLRNCEYADEIAIALAQAPPRLHLIELDLSMGALTDAGAEALLRSEILDSLATLNISQCYISNELLSRFRGLSCSVICDHQRYVQGISIQSHLQLYRYCVVAE